MLKNSNVVEKITSFLSQCVISPCTRSFFFCMVCHSLVLSRLEGHLFRCTITGTVMNGQVKLQIMVQVLEKSLCPICSVEFLRAQVASP